MGVAGRAQVARRGECAMKKLVVLALSGLMVAATLCGCTPAPSLRPALGLAAPRGAPTAASTRPAAAAIPQAEQAVAAAPNDAGSRYRLGRAYLAAGRFVSAGSAFSDALTIDPTQGQAGVMAALALLQQGREVEARSLLARVRDCAPAADLGLALALAGQPDDARTVLEAAARRPGADARTRLNLAFAYAMDGKWSDAAAVAAQDVPADQLPARLHRWALVAQAAARPADRLVAMLGIAPAADSGLPIALALASPRPIVTATAAPAAPSIVPVVSVSPEQPKAHGAARPAARSATGTPKVRMGGRYVVQVGVYYSARQVQAAWTRISRASADMGNYVPAESDVRSSRAHATLRRLSIGGMASYREAMGLCRLIKRRGGDCFVRGSADDRPLIWALHGDGTDRSLIA